jgi:hypothetical protein
MDRAWFAGHWIVGLGGGFMKFFNFRLTASWNHGKSAFMFMIWIT